MNAILLAAALLLAGCAASDAPAARQSQKPTATSDRQRDALDCEREAALSSAGSKAQAFDACMRNRPSR